MLAAGIDVKTVSAGLGHSASSTTLNVYGNNGMYPSSSINIKSYRSYAQNLRSSCDSCFAAINPIGNSAAVTKRTRKLRVHAANPSASINKQCVFLVPGGQMQNITVLFDERSVEEF